MNRQMQISCGLIFTLAAFFTVVSGKAQLECIACGLTKVDPNFDVFGSYDNTTGKKYNHTCAEYEATMSTKPENEQFVRKCPEGVQSCFFVRGKYGDIDMNFRGCSESKYLHSYGCDTTLENVPVTDQRGSTTEAVVETTLCFCNEGLCNVDISGSVRVGPVTGLLLIIVAGVVRL